VFRQEERCHAARDHFSHLVQLAQSEHTHLWYPLRTDKAARLDISEAADKLGFGGDGGGGIFVLEAGPTSMVRMKLLEQGIVDVEGDGDKFEDAASERISVRVIYEDMCVLGWGNLRGRDGDSTVARVGLQASSEMLRY
jgi:hypothetical protein